MFTRKAAYVVAATCIQSLCFGAHANSVVCPNQSAVARERAEHLERSISACKNYILAGARDCAVRVKWSNDVRISVDDAEHLAQALRSFGTEVEPIERRLIRLSPRFEVDTRGTVTTGGQLRCSQTHSFAQSDAQTECLSSCYAEQSPKIADCWRGNIRMLGLCLINEGGRLLACKKSCVAQ